MTRSASSVFATVVVPLLVEFTAQFIHTFWGTMVTTYPATNDATNSLNGTETNGFDYLESVFMPAFQSGLSVWMQIVLFCKISVAHFNPAVSVGFLMAGMLHPVMFLAYVAVQCFSSTLAAYTTKALLGQIPSAVMVPDDVGTYSVLGSEMLLTGILVFFALAMVVDKTYDQHTGAMAVGFTVFQGLLCGKGLGVACLSPSRAFGPAVVVGGKAWDRHWLLWVADIAGAIVASIYYMVFFAPKAKSWLHRFVWKRIDTRKGEDEDFDGAKICEEKEMLQKS